MNYEFLSKKDLIIELQRLGKEIETLKANSGFVNVKPASVLNSFAQSEVRQRLILESLPVVVYSSPMNPEIDTIWISGDVKKVTGYEVDEYLSESDFWRNRIHPQDKERVLNSFKNSTPTTEISIEYQWKCKDQQYRWFHDRSVLVEGETGLEFLGVIIDISERKTFEKELVIAKEKIRESEEWFKAIVQSQFEGVGFVNHDEVFEFANNALEKIFEVEANGLLGAFLFDFLPPGEKLIITQQSENRKKGITNTYEHQIVTKKGNAKYLQVSATPRYSDGIYKGAYAVVRDITQQKLTEIELAVQNKLISKLNKFSIDLASLAPEDNLELFISKGILEFTGAMGATYSEYSSENKSLRLSHIEVEKGVLKFLIDKIGPRFNKISSPVSDTIYQQITNNIIGVYRNLTEASFGAISKTVGDIIQRTIKADRFIGVAYLIEGNLYGSTLIAMGKNQPDPPIEFLENFAFLAAVSLRRKKAELALRESEESYKVITQSTLDVIFGIDKFGKQLFFNKSIEKVLGYTVEEQIGKSFVDFVPKNQVFSYFSVLKEVWLNKEITNFVAQIKHKEGHLVDVEINGKLVTLNGKEVGLGTIRDISERKKSHLELQLAKESYLDIFNSVSEAIYVIDDSGEFIDVNVGAERMYQLVRDELIGKTPASVAAPDRNDLVGIQKIMEDVAKTGIAAKFDFWAVRKDGEVFPKEVIVNRGKYFGKNVLIATARDVTEKKLYEEQLKLKNEELIVSNSNKDKFMYILAHDLRSPFNSILGFSELLHDNLRQYSIDKIEEQIGIINTSAQNFYTLLNDILLWGRSQSGNIPYEPKLLSLTDISDEVLAAVKLNAHIKNITIDHFVLEKIVVFADVDMVKTILRNLISNAIKFTMPGGQISISYFTDSNEVIVRINDSGVGVAKENFDKLFRIDANYTTKGTHNEKGTGLGLVLCKEFVEKLGGRIWIESEVGIGSTFSFSLKRR